MLPFMLNWSFICYVEQDDLELLLFLPPPSKFLDYRHVLPSSQYHPQLSSCDHPQRTLNKITIWKPTTGEAS